MDSQLKEIKKQFTKTKKYSTTEKQEKSLHTELFLLVKVWDTLSNEFLEDAIVTLKYFLEVYSSEFMDHQD